MSTEEMNLQELESQFSEQESLRREKLVKLQEEGKDPFDVYKVKRTHSSKQVKDNFEELEGKEVTVAGRIMSKRGQGKVVFSDIYGFSPIPFDLKICNGSNKYPEKSFFSSNVGTGITCFPCVTRILRAFSISSSVATSFI